MILIIRIAGLVEINQDIQEALFRLRMRRKYSAVLMKETPANLALLQKIRNFVAYGKVDSETLAQLLLKRGVPVGNKKLDLLKASDELEKKSLEELGFKPFFRLHPPRGGIDSKLHFGVKKGVLGDNKEKINDLVRRML